MALDAQILLSILAHESSSEDISRTLRVTPASYSLSLSNGTGANQAQVVWSDSRTATTDIDSLDPAALSDDRGAVAFSALKLIYIKNTGSAIVNWIAGGIDGGPTRNAGDSPVVIRPGGCFVAIATDSQGFNIGNGNFIGIATDAGSTAYDIILIGEGTVT